jgi:hypothetical protein
MHSAKDDTLELIRTFLPKYLTPELRENLFKTIQEQFPLSINPTEIYSKISETEYYYQGDCMVDIPFARFNEGKFETAFIMGIIISNTCDISPDNEKIDIPNIQFASVFSLKEYIETLKNKKLNQQKIDSFVNNLKENRISNLFYLPEKRIGQDVILEESFVRFDINATLPLPLFSRSIYNNSYAPEGDRLVSFSNYGFYLFLIKLSLHYCRFREGVFRNE